MKKFPKGAYLALTYSLAGAVFSTVCFSLKFFDKKIFLFIIPCFVGVALFILKREFHQLVKRKKLKNQSARKNYLLARELYRQGDVRSAQIYYCRAIYGYFEAHRLKEATFVFKEYFARYHKIFSPKLQLIICQKLCVQGEYLLASRALEKLIDEWERSFSHHHPKYLQQAYLHLARIYAEKLKLPILAQEKYFQFLERFPKSAWRETALFQLQLLDQKLSQAVKKVA